MAIHSTPRLSRLSDRAVVVQRQLITFSIAQTNFLLPLDWSFRAVVFEIQHVRDGQVHFADRSLPLMDVDRSILGKPNTDGIRVLDHGAHDASDAILQSLAKPIAGLILQQPGSEPQWVLPIDSAPSLCRIPDDCFLPLPRTYTVRCVSEMTDNSSDYPLYFLLDPKQLFSEAVAINPDRQTSTTTATAETGAQAMTTIPNLAEASDASAAPPASLL